MNRKVLCIAVFLMAAAILASPLVGPAEACNTNRYHYRWEKFEVAASYSFLDTLNGEHKYYPSEADQKKVVISWDENVTTCDIMVGGVTYSLGKDFTYSGHAVMVFYDPVYNPAVTLLYPANSSSSKMRVDYMYDFSSVPGGLKGVIRLVATLENGVLSIRSLWGTRDFEDVEIRATSTSTFDEATLMVNLSHNGRVSGWPCVVPASMAATPISYDDLTALCLAAGLSENPYPAPPVSTVTGPDENGIVHIANASAYYTFNQTIGSKVYEGISCNVIDYTYNVVTLELDGLSRATWYFGELGSMRSGFRGVVVEYIYGWDEATQTFDYYVIDFNMYHGFGRFSGQSLWMHGDSRVNPLSSTGYCLFDCR